MMSSWWIFKLWMRFLFLPGESNDDYIWTWWIDNLESRHTLFWMEGFARLPWESMQFFTMWQIGRNEVISSADVDRNNSKKNPGPACHTFLAQSCNYFCSCFLGIVAVLTVLIGAVEQLEPWLLHTLYSALQSVVAKDAEIHLPQYFRMTQCHTWITPGLAHLWKLMISRIVESSNPGIEFRHALDIMTIDLRSWWWMQ